MSQKRQREKGVGVCLHNLIGGYGPLMRRSAAERENKKSRGIFGTNIQKRGSE